MQQGSLFFLGKGFHIGNIVGFPTVAAIEIAVAAAMAIAIAFATAVVVALSATVAAFWPFATIVTRPAPRIAVMATTLRTFTGTFVGALGAFVRAFVGPLTGALGRAFGRALGCCSFYRRIFLGLIVVTIVGRNGEGANGNNLDLSEG